MDLYPELNVYYSSEYPCVSHYNPIEAVLMKIDSNTMHI